MINFKKNFNIGKSRIQKLKKFMNYYNLKPKKGLLFLYAVILLICAVSQTTSLQV